MPKRIRSYRDKDYEGLIDAANIRYRDRLACDKLLALLILYHAKEVSGA